MSLAHGRIGSGSALDSRSASLSEKHIADLALASHAVRKVSGGMSTSQVTEDDTGTGPARA